MTHQPEEFANSLCEKLRDSAIQSCDVRWYSSESSTPSSDGYGTRATAQHVLWRMCNLYGPCLAAYVLVAPGATLRVVSDKARIEVARELVLAPLEYQGPLKEISTSQQNTYELKGRPKYYNFKVMADDITADELVVELPIIIDSDRDLGMVHAQFDNSL